MRDPVLDTIIHDGVIVDGTRFPRFKGDIGIRDGEIVEVGRLDRAEAHDRIDASGLIVAPGHIDLHTHYDAQIFWDPYCSNSGENGVTTVVTGNCGFGFAPCRPGDRERSMLMMENTEQVPVKQLELALPWSWETYPEWLEALRAQPKGVNVLMFMPLNPLMIYVMGLEGAKSRRPTPDELAEMKRLIHEAMDAGACGIAMSFLPHANSHTDFDRSPMPTDRMHPDDAVELAAVLGERGDGFIQITPQLMFDMDYETPERMAEASGRPVVVVAVVPTPLKPDSHRPQLRWLEEMQEKGHQIYGHGFLHRAWAEFNLLEFSINDHVPLWRELSSLASPEDKLARIAEPRFRNQMVESYDPMDLAIGSGALDGIYVSAVAGHPELEHYVGKTLGEIARAEGKHVIEVLFDISLATRGTADFRTGSLFLEDPDLVAEALRHPLVLAGMSDGGAHIKFAIGGHWPTENITWLHRDSGAVSLEDLHAILSHDLARVAGIPDRGTLRPGMKADIIVYDLDALALAAPPYQVKHDLPGGDWRRYRQTHGYKYVLVNGVVTHRDGRATGGHPGRFVSVTSAQRQAARGRRARARATSPSFALDTT